MCPWSDQQVVLPLRYKRNKHAGIKNGHTSQALEKQLSLCLKDSLGCTLAFFPLPGFAFETGIKHSRVHTMLLKSSFPNTTTRHHYLKKVEKNSKFPKYSAILNNRDFIFPPTLNGFAAL